MNIGFGSAAADLSGVIDLYVQLSVPEVKVIPATELIVYIEREIPNSHEITVIEQNYWSRFKGMALLAFTSGAGKTLLGLLGDMDEHAFESDPMRILERETLMEVGNILVGACVGKVAELLGDVVTYSPPRILIGNMSDTNVSRTLFGPGNCVVILQPVFHFGNQDVRDNLFLVAPATNPSSGLGRPFQVFMSRYA
jgi:chemotaxis protein CheC